MKKYSYLSVILSAVLLTGCGVAQQSSNKEAGNEGVIIEAATEEVTVEPTTDKGSDPPICTPPVSISEFECFGRKFDAAYSNVKSWCHVWNDRCNIRTNYENKNISASDLDPEYIAALVNELTSGKYEETKPFTGDHCICLDNAIDGICIVSGSVELCSYDDLDNLTMDSQPAMYISSGDDKVSYRVTEEFKNEFDAVVEKVTVSEENIRDTYELPDHSYRDITEHEYHKDSILFISLYSNWAEGIQINGSFIDSLGYVYKFNFDGMDIQELCKEREKTDEYAFDDALLDSLYYDVYYKEKPFAKVDSDEIIDIYMEQYGIGAESQMEKESVGCDMGQRSLYVLDTGKWELIQLRTSGDWEGFLDDECAIDMCERFDSLEYETIE